MHAQLLLESSLAACLCLYTLIVEQNRQEQAAEQRAGTALYHHKCVLSMCLRTMGRAATGQPQD